MNAKFFVIKSYSEDDVHKSIKYNVWSSTPNGNKKLNAAYEDAQRIAAGDSRGCPIFLFFSVNASGQFCGVAEMTGPVDFHKDMDFWQQDKWSGSFPVKWRIIKDVPNPNFRHIILENNENKPVTNSRDTQEIHYNKGMEMLKIFKNYISKTSLLDDFMYYENRQKILHEEKARLLFKSYENPYLVPPINPPRRLATILDPSSEDKKVGQHDESNSSKKNESDFVKHVSSDADSLDAKPNVTDEFKITSLTIKSKESKSECLAPASATEANDESTDVIREAKEEFDGVSSSSVGPSSKIHASQFFSALDKKEGYVHILPIDDWFHILPKPPMTIQEALPHTGKWWPSCYTRKQLSSISCETKGIYPLCEGLRRMLIYSKGFSNS
ncbi:uncharacterized protein Fot_20880 [Forsythia ovata]|uniref:YTH domain-containing family protein n=1 Tax=Forsythia ovata TaxID=205694 RepID=A0ABD1UT93_9LAMI